MTNFFYITGVIFWAVLAVIALASAMYYGVQAVVKLYQKYIGPTLSNIKVYFCFLKEAHKDMPEYLEKLRNNQ